MARSRRSILQAAQELLAEQGVAAVTIEGVAERAGVARTTVYRQWADRGELLLALLEKPVEKEAIDDTGDLRADLVTHFVHLERDVMRGPKASTLLALAENAERDPGFEGIARDFARRRRAAVVRRLQAGVAVGQLAGDADLDLLASAIAGALFYRRFLGRTTTSTTEIAALVDALLSSPPRRACGAGSGSPRSPR